MGMMKRIIAAALSVFLATATFMAAPVYAQGTTQFGPLIDGLTLLPAPVQPTDKIPMQRGGSANGFQAPASTFLQTFKNLSDIKASGAAAMQAARTNLGLGPAVSILDYPSADPTGGTSSDSAFTSCVTSGKNCYIPAGTFLISCTAHNTNAGITVFGDGWRNSTLRLTASCALGTGGIINLANVQDISLDMNLATAAASTRIISNYNGGSAVAAPIYSGLRIFNGAGPNMFLIQVNAPVTVANAVVKNNFLSVNAASSTVNNHCILFSNGGASITSGQITQNVCVNNSIDIAASNVVIEDNDVSGWNFKAGIQLEQTSDTNNNHIINNRLHNSGTAIDVTGSPANGIVNWGKSSEINSNRCWLVGGACIDNGGQNSLISGNWALNNETRVDAGGNVAYFTFYQDATFNGNGSSWIGNYGTDDRGVSARQVGGYQDMAGNTNIQLIGNSFPGATIPYLFN